MKRLLLALVCLAPAILAAPGARLAPASLSGASRTFLGSLLTLAQLTGDYWEWRLAIQPELATRVGRPDHNDRWRDLVEGGARSSARSGREEFLQQALYVGRAISIPTDLRERRC